MFNLYYVNYKKAFEIAMQIDNKLLEKQVKELDLEKSGSGSIGVETSNTLIGKIFSGLSGSASFSASKSDRTEDTLKVISTKSTILAPVIQRSVEVKKLGDDRIGKLLKIKDVSLRVVNYRDMVGSKIMLNGLLKNVPVEGLGSMDLTSIANTVLKGASYIVVGQIPDRVSVDTSKGSDKLLFKIPLQMDDEMENSYSVSDLEIGPVTVVGIYRGVFQFKDIKNQVDVIAKISGDKSFVDTEIELETENDVPEVKDRVEEIKNDLVHYIDVIAIIQELF